MRIENKSLNDSLDEGKTDGKYRKVRPDTFIAPGMGAEIVRANRAGLDIYNGFGLINQEASFFVDPAGR